MSVKDFMTRKVVYISPDTTIAHAADIMREQDLHRLPVIENDKLVGLVTEGTIAEASPSKATSLSIYEMNYLLNKTKVKDVMIKNVITVSGYASLEDAAYLMYKNKVGILPVVDNGQLYGVITDRDIFAAFLHVSGYGEEGVRARFLVENKAGELEKLFDWWQIRIIILYLLYNLLPSLEKLSSKYRLTEKLMLKKFELFSRVQVSKWIAWFRLLLKYLKPRFLGFSLAIILVF